MRIALFAVALAILSAPAARANKLTYIPRLAGRTARNMATFRDKQAAAEEWSCVLVAFADGYVSWHASQIAANLHEANPIFGPRPSLAHYSAVLVPTGFGEAALTQLAHEWFDGTKWKWETYTPIAISGAAHVYGIAATEHVIRTDCRTAGIVCR